ncbi:hypothetical protein CBR_g3481 [Chara braunii]|uniref:Uncharacterized protein n=1 Tax=Chara braunii TaxID=69332 RepID=A0A388JR36_CHABU|nr:hypothetical protein CBR_g3481 [Chara braunii]|eukprot:GBG60237.1 hypothetical protein CBR_g3481 [Chara braunii]
MGSGETKRRDEMMTWQARNDFGAQWGDDLALQCYQFGAQHDGCRDATWREERSYGGYGERNDGAKW